MLPILVEVSLIIITIHFAGLCFHLEQPCLPDSSWPHLCKWQILKLFTASGTLLRTPGTYWGAKSSTFMWIACLLTCSSLITESVMESSVPFPLAVPPQSNNSVSLRGWPLHFLTLNPGEILTWHLAPRFHLHLLPLPQGTVAFVNTPVNQVKFKAMKERVRFQTLYTGFSVF